MSNKMYFLKIIMSGVGETLVARYKDKTSAEKAKEKIEFPLFGVEQNEGELKGGRPILIEDDFGLSMKIPYYSILLVMMIDFEQAAEGDATCQFLQHKTANRTIEKLNASSPIISPIQSPYGNGGRRI
jgi:hypothetical protein